MSVFGIHFNLFGSEDLLIDLILEIATTWEFDFNEDTLDQQSLCMCLGLLFL